MLLNGLKAMGIKLRLLVDFFDHTLGSKSTGCPGRMNSATCTPRFPGQFFAAKARKHADFLERVLQRRPARPLRPGCFRGRCW
ncbi:MAG TPA: hypothetical protein DIW77_10640 [Chromatiaceae bacterium]|nr:MAG: hypothetical protein N838_04375 [Thiohalocapsa sp. PB-PSB1]HCS90487.1 hypothetical protein [Chromatiaceae bacterium]